MKYFFAVLLQLVSFSLKAQEISHLDSLLNDSFFQFIEKRKKSYNKGILPNNYFENLCFLIDNLPRNFHFSREIQDMGFSYFTLINPNTKNIKKKKEYIVIFSDIFLINSQLKISLSDRRVIVWGKKNISISVSDWADYIYEYSCNEEKWILIKTEYGGI